GKQSKLIERVRLGRTTVSSFFNQKPIGESSFRKICLALRINWEACSAVKEYLKTPESYGGLIQNARKHCRQRILSQHSKIRLLSGQEIDVDQLYVDVWLLDKPERRYFNTSESLLSSFDISKDRLALSRRIQRNPGFDIANQNSTLLVLGKPGSGKTTFLKHLAVDWSKGKFQPEKITVLIELRRIRDPDWNLVQAIAQELELEEERAILDLLRLGKLIVLMDGLDEVPTDKLRDIVKSQIEAVSKKFPNKNRLVLTCRTQIMRTSPGGFTSVEVADFNSEQVQQFVLNWFIANGCSKAESIAQWESIQDATINQPD
ncbi:MAG: NACHT domain-containing protein, partial [Cyanobacteria bacterium J06649_11]